MSSLIGKKLQGVKYKLENVLGRGGFGLTFRAHQNYLDQVVVIKTLNESFWSDPNLTQLQKQFQDEARRLALCSHPNVVRVSDFFIEDQLPYMVMDYIPGRSLYDMVFRADGGSQPLSEADAIAYVQQIGQALQAVHARGLLHRDVKPQNIMIHQLTGQAVLIDFGIARELTQNPAKTHTSIVSEGYAPIEQYLPKAQRSAATDIYGLAATLYTLLTGEIPVAAVLRDRNPLLPIQQLRPDVSQAVANAIAQGMQIELKDRPQSVNRWIASLTSPSAETSQNINPTVSPRASSEDTSKAGQSQKTLQKTQQPQSTFQQNLPGQVSPQPTPSEFPTRVVSPAYQETSTRMGGSQGGALGNPVNRSTGRKTESKTVAVPLPTDTAAVGTDQAQVRAKNSGCGCFSTLAMTTLLVAGIAGAGGYWAVQQFAGGLPTLSEIGRTDDDIAIGDTTEDDTTDSLPDDAIEDPTDPLEEDSDDNDDGNDEDNLLDRLKKPKKEDAITEEPDDSTTPIDPPNSEGNSSPSGSPPLLLSNSGNPANAQPGGNGNIVAVPGFAPGDSASQVRNRLGTPSQASTVNGYQTDVYSLVPNRVQLGYVYDQDSEMVQSEVTFSAGVDRLVMRTTLLGMLDGRSTREIEQGLEAVRSGEQNRFDFESRGFLGSIERNAYDHVHIYVQN
ncbi:MAG: serine/threonine-protein kinase [Cyanobacteria bacterium J06621_11]